MFVNFIFSGFLRIKIKFILLFLKVILKDLMLVFWNALSLILLFIAIYFARVKKYTTHKIFITLSMLASFALVYVFIRQRFEGNSLFQDVKFSELSTPFAIFLISHIIAAVTSFFMSLITYTLGLSSKLRPKYHKKWAYKLIPIWIYSSVTGIMLYFLIT